MGLLTAFLVLRLRFFLGQEFCNTPTIIIRKNYEKTFFGRLLNSVTSKFVFSLFLLSTTIVVDLRRKGFERL